MAPTLYRKYRPQVFDDIVGQQHIKTTLLNELRTGRIAHAYVFSGPRGVGKTTVARLFAKAVNCAHPKADGGPDDACDACVDIREGRSLDLVEIDAASNTGVDHVREHIIENARFTPSRWKYKVFIIDEVHMLSLSAFNALLKTLEEPPAHALFILATTEVHKIPETILSRCQRFDFRQLRHDDIVERLKSILQREEVEVEDEVLDAIARNARGAARDAESALGQVLTLGSGGKITMDEVALVLPRSDIQLVLGFFEAVVRKDATTGVQLINRLVSEGVSLPKFTQDVIELTRKALLLKVSSQLDMFSTLDLAPADEQRMLQLLDAVDVRFLERALQVFLEREQQLRSSFLPQLPLELAVVELSLDGPQREDAAPVAPQPSPPRPPVPPSAPTSEPTRSEEADASSGPAPKPAAKKAPKKTGGLTLEDLRAMWSKIVQHVKGKNQSLTMTLNVALPHEVSGERVVLAVGYAFHQERLEAPKNRAMLEEAFAEILGAPVSIETVVLPDLAQRMPSFEQEANVETVEVGVKPAAPPVAAPSAPATGGNQSWDQIVQMFTTPSA